LGGVWTSFVDPIDQLLRPELQWRRNPAEEPSSHPAAIQPLTYNWTSVNNTINAMSPGGATIKRWDCNGAGFCNKIRSTHPPKRRAWAISASSSSLPTA
jgi:hypothetical protein